MLLGKKAVGILLLAVSLVAGGCKDEDDSSSGDGPFLKAADLTPGGKLKEVSESALQSTLKDESFLYDNEPAASTAKKFRALLLAEDAEGDDEDCVGDVFDTFVAEGDAQNLIFQGNVDVSSCFKGEATAGLSFSVGFGGYIQFGCDNVDLSPYLGKTLGELSNGDGQILKDVVCNTAKLLMNSQADVTVSGSLTEDGQSHTINFRSVNYGYLGDSNGAPCTKTVAGEEATFSDGCLAIDKSVDLVDQLDGKASEDEGAEDYERYETVGIKGGAKNDKTYYTAGKVKAQVNGWLGELTYSGPDTPPLYVMNNGTKQVEGALGVYGTGYVTFGDVEEMAVGTCGKFELVLKSGSTPVPAKADVEIAMTSTDGLIFSDAECKTPATKVVIAKATSSVTFYAQPKDAATYDFTVKGEVKTSGYGTSAVGFIKITGVDTGYLVFDDDEKIRPGECKRLAIKHDDDTAATADIVIALASEDVDLFADAACETATTSVTLKKDAKSVDFYVTLRAGETLSAIISGTPANGASTMSSAYLTVEDEVIAWSDTTAITVNTCTKFTLTHGFGEAATPAAVTADLVIALSSVKIDYYADDACTAPEITQVTIAAGSDHVDFYVKATTTGSGLMTADPAGDSINTEFQSVDVN